MTIGTTGFATAVTSTSVTVDGGTNRMFFASVSQRRTPANLASPVTLNGVSGEILQEVADTQDASSRHILVRWVDANLPAAGSYTLAFTGMSAENKISWLNATDIDQGAAEASSPIQSVDSAGTVWSESLTITSGALVLAGIYHQTDRTTVDAGTAVGTDVRGYMLYREDGNTLGATIASANSYVGFIASFAPASGGGGGVTLTTSPAEIKNQETAALTITSTATVPTPVNTDVKFTDTNGVAATVDSVTANGGDSYDINVTWARTAAQKFDRTTGPVVYIEVTP